MLIFIFIFYTYYMLINIHVYRGDRGIISENETLKVYTREPFENNRANIDIIKQLSKFYKVHESSIKIVSGLKSRKKIIKIEE